MRSPVVPLTERVTRLRRSHKRLRGGRERELVIRRTRASEMLDRSNVRATSISDFTARFRRVEQALALSTDMFELAATSNADLWQAIQHAIDTEVPEDNDLDFRSTWWSDTKELAKDRAAFANAAGGVLVFGVDDDKREMAAAWSPRFMPWGHLRHFAA